MQQRLGSESLLSRRLRLLTGLLAIVASTTAAADKLSGDAARQGDGGVSAFYRWNRAIPKSPGKLLRSERLPVAAGLANAGRQIRFLYSSTEGLTGQGTTVVSGALFTPRGRPPKDGWPVIAWAHGTVGVGDVCAPSWGPRSERDAEYLNRWLAQGYAVVASDYQGLGTAGLHPYLSVRTGAYNVLDSVRAVAGRVLHVGTKAVVVGQSQGAGVAFATAALAATYARELDLRGTVATGVPYFTPKTLTAAGLKVGADEVKPETAFLLYMAIAGQLVDPSARDEDIVSAEALPLFTRARTACVHELMKDVVDAGLTRTEAMGRAFAPLVGRYAREFVYPTLALQTPVFVGMGSADEFTAASVQMMLVRDACAAGSLVEAHVYPGLDHNGTVNGSLGDSLPFVRKLFAGEPIASSCSAVSP